MIPDTVIQSIYTSSAPDELSYAFICGFTQKLTDNILAFSESCMDVINEPVKNRKKVYFIIVESLQNITRHQELDVMDCFFSVHRSSTGFRITSGNIIENENIPSLREKMDMINSMNQEELKAHYYAILNEGDFSEKGGAGLGLVEMVRKSGNKVLYHFEEISGCHSYFYFQINVTTSEQGEDISGNLNIARQCHSQLKEQGVKLFYRGIIEPEALKEFVEATECSFPSEVNAGFRKHFISSMTATVQNIYAYRSNAVNDAASAAGMIVVSGRQNGYTMTSGHWISNERIAEFENIMKQTDALESNKEESGIQFTYRSATEFSRLQLPAASSFHLIKIFFAKEGA